MIPILVLVAVALTAGSGLPAFLTPGSPGRGERLSAALVVAGSAAGLGAALAAFLGEPGAWSSSWRVPGGALAIRVDALAAMFLAQIFLLAALGAVYGLAYWPDRDHPEDGRKLRVCYGLATAGMAVVVVAANSVLFLAAWEVMALAAFLLVSTEDRDLAVREAGVVYLVATRVGTLSLFAFFAILRSLNGTHDLRAPPIAGDHPAATALMVLAIVGFGLKAGIMPLHLWLPGAHASAPTHVSALMSGVLIKMGIYGLARFLSFFAAPPAWWGTLLLFLGGVSGVLGVGFAIGQHDVKRLLAYHSVENIGIILMAFGVGVVGLSHGDLAIFALGMGGGLLHTWNHGLFKALLFLSAGSVVHASHTRDIDHLGGLAKRMPLTAAAFLLGALAICGLPPLNGFVSELLAYLAFARACTGRADALWAAGAIGAPVLALIGALALACFVKVSGGIFLGAARSDHAGHAVESPRSMLVPMAVLAAGCVTIGVAPLLVAPVIDGALRAFPVASAPGSVSRLRDLAPLRDVSIAGLLLAASLGAASLWASRVRRAAPSAPTWDCGYAAPSARMQYTSSSFAELLVGMLSAVLRPERRDVRLERPFPRPATFGTDVPEIVLDRAVRPALRLAARAAASFAWVQQGKVQVYLLYVLGALVVLLLLWR
jgi:hydrogenase-4 component B